MKKISILSKKLNVSAFAFVVAMGATSYSHAHSSKMDRATYVGVDAVYNTMKFKKDFGANIFKKSAPGVNLFVGHMFHQHFGAELGFEMDKKAKRDVTVPMPAYIAGAYIPAAAVSEAYKTTVKQNHPYVGVVAKINVFGDNHFVGLILGMSLSNIKAQYNNYLSNGAAVNTIRNFNKTKAVTFMKASFEHKFNSCVGAKVFAGWRNMSQFKINSKESGSISQVKLKDAFNFGLGVAYYI